MPICINLGSGHSIAEPNDPKEIWFNLDLGNNPNVDLVANLEEGLPFRDESVEVLYASHVFEHIRNFPELMQECYRVLKPRGILHIKVPCMTCRAAFADPTHYRYFAPETFYHFDEDSDIGYDTLGMRRMGFWLKWLEVVRHHAPDLDDGLPGSYFTEIIVDYEKHGPAYDWEERLLELANGKSSDVKTGFGTRRRMLGKSDTPVAN